MAGHARKAPAGGKHGAKLSVHDRNIQELAALITTEAGGTGTDAETSVGWTVMNRMKRNAATTVDQVWNPAFRHGKKPGADALAIARGILDGTTPDPTGGATHFYTPQAMPKKGDSTKNSDATGGLESVPGVVDDDGNPVQNYRPSWVSGMTQQTVPGIPARIFKFYKATGTGHVH